MKNSELIDLLTDRDLELEVVVRFTEGDDDYTPEAGDYLEIAGETSIIVEYGKLVIIVDPMPDLEVEG